MESIFKSKKPGSSVQTSLSVTKTPQCDPSSLPLATPTNPNASLQTPQALVFQKHPTPVNNIDPTNNNNAPIEENNLKKSPNQFVNEEVPNQNNNNNINNTNQQIASANNQLQFRIESCFTLATQPEVKLGTGCKVINDFLRGGFMPRRLYEIYGESGTGKTQFAIQLLLNSILPEKAAGLNGGALYVMAAKSLNEKRFSEMKDHFLKQNQSIATLSDLSIKSQIQLVQANNLDDYNKIFLNLAHRIEQEQTKLVVIDNILAVCDNFIKADGQVDFIERSNFLQRHTKQLKRLAHDFGLVVVIMNNVVADMNNNNQNGQGFFADQQKKQQITVPALGLIWTNCINERIGLRKKQMGGQQDVKRTMLIEKSAFMRRSDCEFEITNVGLRGKH